MEVGDHKPISKKERKKKKDGRELLVIKIRDVQNIP